ncbi:aspartyl-phosphate phosphatase Spo0E family protein [Zhaonella formicivorans]|uniref:aspartyl-phosphate phosphatase Spo0E family protein n=1 Tax=Zhaonella formicivorans TaxID=2528593 RepID=UPI0010EA411D|nr:aspartyl-phosphate phosphatase Spo0E family protein [Zhaonella formicivorans]
MKGDKLAKLISLKSQELTKLALSPKVTLLDKDVYQKSCELDELVVKYMKQVRKRA